MKALYICNERAEWNKFVSFFSDNLSNVKLLCANTQGEAIDIIIQESPISVVIIDHRLKEDENQIDLASKLTEASGQRPIIFISEQEGVDGVISSDFFNRYLTNDVIELPYSNNVLLVSIKKALEWSLTEGGAHKTTSINEEEYVSIKLKNFFLYDQVTYDVFYLIYAGSYMKVISKNKRYPESTIHALAQKNIKKLYFKKSEKIKFLEESMDKATSILSDPKTKVEKIFTTQACGVSLIHQMINEVGVSSSVIKLSKRIIDIVPTATAGFPDFLSLYKALPLNYEDIAEQSIFMLYLNFMLLKSLTWESDMTKRKVGLACILHDCKFEDDKLSSIRNEEDESFKELGSVDLKLFKSHALDAARISTEFTDFPDCGFIIREHHVIPKGRYIQKMNSISCMFALSRRLTTELSHFGFTTAGLSLSLTELKEYSIGNFKQSYNELLKFLIKF